MIGVVMLKFILQYNAINLFRVMGISWETARPSNEVSENISLFS